MAERDDQRHVDILDQAEQTSQLFLDADISRARAKAAPESHPDFDGAHCVEEECGEEIPAPRLAMGRVRCVNCQDLLERKARNVRR